MTPCRACTAGRLLLRNTTTAVHSARCVWFVACDSACRKCKSTCTARMQYVTLRQLKSCVRDLLLIQKLTVGCHSA